MFRDETFQAHQARVPEQVRADLALLKVTQEDAIEAARQGPGDRNRPAVA